MISKYFLYFIIYSFLGWCIEVGDKFVEYKRFINRGFIIGPLCTIYGVGVLCILGLLGNNSNDLLSVFLKSVLICSVLEYFTSYVMEKVFSAKWWDYSSKKFNLNGRICLETMVPFGILGCFVYYILNPIVIYVVDLIPVNLVNVVAFVIFVLFVADYTISLVVTFKIKNKIKSNGDSTEYIRKEVLKWINDNSFLYRRLKNSYPSILINYNEFKRKLSNQIPKSIKKDIINTKKWVICYWFLLVTII